jgi:hypothetical protein
MTEVRLTDERLAWLAVRDQIQRETAPSIIMRIVGAMTFSRDAREARELAGDKRSAYAFAVDDVARELQPEERRILREAGMIPAWFLPEVRRRVKAG